jgi:uncharacterized integral membrane protein
MAEQRSSGNWVAQAKFVVDLGVLVQELIVIFENLDTYKFEILFFWRPEISISAVMVGIFLAGVLVGMVTLHLLQRRRRGK